MSLVVHQSRRVEFRISYLAHVIKQPNFGIPNHKKSNKKVNKKNIQNSENWLFDDMSEIHVLFQLRLPEEN